MEGCYGDVPLPEGVVPTDALDKAEREYRDKLGDFRAKAREHLIPRPGRDDFTLAQTFGPVKEDEEGNRRDYFHAQTRLGADTQSVLVLHDPDTVSLVKKESPRNGEALRRAFLRKATLPAWWLRRVSVVEGFDPCFDGPDWLRGHVVIPMLDGKWQGRDDKGRLVTLVDDPTLGLMRIAEGEEDADF